jgi:hypothetical protein
MGDLKDTFLLEGRSSNSDYKDIKGGNVRIKKVRKKVFLSSLTMRFLTSADKFWLPRHNVFLLLVVYSLERTLANLDES